MRSIVATASTGYCAGGRFGRQHDSVGAFEHGGRHVRHFGAGRHRRGDHRFQHLRRHDHRLAGAAAGARDLLLDAGHGFQRHLDAEVAARHHQRVGQLDDLVEPGDRLRLLDLRHQQRAAARDLARLGQIVRPLDEGQRHPVDAGCQHGVEVARSLSVSAPTGRSVSGRLTPFLSEILLPATTVQTIDLPSQRTAFSSQLAVVDQQAMAGLDRLQDFRMRQVTRVSSPGAGLSSSVKVWPAASSSLAVGELADAQLRPLQVGQNADRPAERSSTARMRPTSVRISSWSVWLILMRNTSAPASNSLLDHRLVGRGGSERGEDLDFAAASH